MRALADALLSAKSTIDLSSLLPCLRSSINPSLLQTEGREGGGRNGGEGGGVGGLALLVLDDGVDQKRDLESDQRKSTLSLGNRSHILTAALGSLMRPSTKFEVS